MITQVRRILFGTVFFCGGFAAHSAAPHEAAAKDSVFLECSYVLDAPQPTIRCVLTNLGGDDIANVTLGLSGNHLVYLRPDGTVYAPRADVQQSRRGVRRTIRPGETVEWRVPLSVADWAPGTHRVYWIFGRLKSRELSLVKEDAKEEVRPDGRGGGKRPPIETWKFIIEDLAGAGYRGIDLLVADDEANAEQQALIVAITGRMVGLTALRSAAKERYGAKALDGWRVDLGDIRTSDLENARVTFPEHFEEAIIHTRVRPVRVVRMGSTEWKVPIGSYVGGRTVSDIRRQEQVFRKLAEEVERGRYRRLEDVDQSLRQKLGEIAPEKG